MASPEHIMWSDEKVLFFIDVYRAREVLWNPKNEDFYKQNLKKDAWSEVARLTSTSAEICRNKMTSILASFRREKAKEKNSMGTGKGTSDTYTSRWFAYEALKFLSDRNTPRKRKNTESLQQSATPNVPEQAGEFTPPAPASPPQAKRNRKAQNDVLSDVMGVLKSTAQKLETSAGISDVTKSFAFFIGGKMSMYSLQTRTAVEHAMFDIIMKADRGYYENGPIRFHPDNQDARQRNVPYSTLPSTSVGPPPGTYAAAPYDYTPADYSSNQTPYSVSPPSSFASSFNEFADLM